MHGTCGHSQGLISTCFVSEIAATHLGFEEFDFCFAKRCRCILYTEATRDHLSVQTSGLKNVSLSEVPTCQQRSERCFRENGCQDRAHICLRAWQRHCLWSQATQGQSSQDDSSCDRICSCSCFSERIMDVWLHHRPRLFLTSSMLRYPLARSTLAPEYLACYGTTVVS